MAKPSADETSSATPNLLPSQVADTLDHNLEHMSFQELMGLFDEGGIVHIQEIDDELPVEKADLVGRPLIITSWRHNPKGQFGEDSEFIVARIKLLGMSNETLNRFFTDGSTGIKDQLLSWREKMGDRPLYAPKGLRRSDYLVDDPFNPGTQMKATTFYISNES